MRQINERCLSKIEVERAIRTPWKLVQQSLRRYRAVQIIRKRSKRYLLVVIYDVRNSVREVVTAFLTAKLEKYL